MAYGSDVGRFPQRRKATSSLLPRKRARQAERRVLSHKRTRHGERSVLPCERGEASQAHSLSVCTRVGTVGGQSPEPCAQCGASLEPSRATCRLCSRRTKPPVLWAADVRRRRRSSLFSVQRSNSPPVSPDLPLPSAPPAFNNRRSCLYVAPSACKNVPPDAPCIPNNRSVIFSGHTRNPPPTPQKRIINADFNNGMPPVQAVATPPQAHVLRPPPPLPPTPPYVALSDVSSEWISGRGICHGNSKLNNQLPVSLPGVYGRVDDCKQMIVCNQEMQYQNDHNNVLQLCRNASTSSFPQRSSIAGCQSTMVVGCGQRNTSLTGSTISTSGQVFDGGQCMPLPSTISPKSFTQHAVLASPASLTEFMVPTGSVSGVISTSAELMKCDDYPGLLTVSEQKVVSEAQPQSLQVVDESLTGLAQLETDGEVGQNGFNEELLAWGDFISDFPTMGDIDYEGLEMYNFLNDSV